MSVTADDRIAQAEMDAARAREIAEERRDRRDGVRRGRELARYVGAYANGSGTIAILGATMIRDFVRSEIIPSVVGRLYEVGMGIAEFDTVVGGGEDGPTIVQLEAPATVQVAALRELVAIGIPRQLGMVDGKDKEIPGVFVLGEARLEEAREVASHGDYMGAIANDRPIDDGMQARIDAGEFETVEVDESITAFADTAEKDAKTPLPEPPTRLEDEILARRRNGRKDRTD